MIGNFALVALGGALGAMLRYGLVTVLGLGAWGVLGVNVLGSGVMGVCVVLLIERGGAVWLPPLVMTGVLGGFTTFSAFSADALGLIERGRGDLALVYVAGSVLVSLAACWAGMVTARAVL